MDKKQLELILQKTPSHPSPKYELEQYLTPANLAAQIIWIAYLKGDIRGKIVVDLGCGTGIFCKGITLLGGYCLCVDVDNESLSLAKDFIGRESASFIQAEVSSLTLSRRVDSVIQNPPFGVVKRGMDIIFLNKALEIANYVYSLHKSNEKSRELISRIASDMGFKNEVISLNYRLKYYYPWHKKKFHEFYVDLYRFYKD